MKTVLTRTLSFALAAALALMALTPQPAGAGSYKLSWWDLYLADGSLYGTYLLTRETAQTYCGKDDGGGSIAMVVKEGHTHGNICH